jgi:site-specific DNA recombinase
VEAGRRLAMIAQGKTFTEIAESESTSKRRIKDVVELALLGPNVMKAITTGEQPDGLTSDYLIKTGFPVIWAEQREKFAAL